MQFALLINIC